MKYWVYLDFLFPLQLCHQPLEILILFQNSKEENSLQILQNSHRNGKKQSYLTIWTTTVSAPAHGCETQIFSSVVAAATGDGTQWLQLSSHRELWCCETCPAPSSADTGHKVTEGCPSIGNGMENSFRMGLAVFRVEGALKSLLLRQALSSF